MKSSQFPLLLACVILALSMTILSAIAAPPNVGTTGPKVAEDRPGAPWIALWYGLDGPITANGGHGPGSDVDWIDKGTDGQLTDETLSTMTGLEKTQRIDEVDMGNNGGVLGWGIFTIDPADGDNMGTRYGLGAIDNIDTYQIIVLDVPKARTAVMGPAHDDHAQIWINGTKVYGNAEWTGAALRVSYDVEVELEKGYSVLLYRCSEGGGSAYANLHFDDETTDAIDVFPETTDVDDFWRDLRRGFAVEPTGKLSTVWGDVKMD